MLQSTVIISACARFIDEVTQRAPGLPAVWQPLAITFFTDAQGIPTHSSSVHACKTAGEFARSAAEAGRRRGRTPHATLDDKRRLKMATDTARGMNYLHSCRPPIIHRDLKSPNLLVDKDFTIKARFIGFGLGVYRRELKSPNLLVDKDFTITARSARRRPRRAQALRSSRLRCVVQSNAP